VKALCRYFKERNPEFVATGELGELFEAAYLDQGIHTDYIFVAHEHNLAYYYNVNSAKVKPVLRQFISGGGSGETHPRVSYRHHPDVGFHLKDSGFVVVTCDSNHTNSITLDVHTLTGLHLRLNESNPAPILKEHQ